MKQQILGVIRGFRGMGYQSGAQQLPAHHPMRDAILTIVREEVKATQQQQEQALKPKPKPKPVAKKKAKPKPMAKKKATPKPVAKKRATPSRPLNRHPLDVIAATIGGRARPRVGVHPLNEIAARIRARKY